MLTTLPALLLCLCVIALVAHMARVNSTITVGGQTISGAVTRLDATEIGSSPVSPLAAAKAGTLTTRTDNNTGTLTMATGHGITTGQKIDLYWVGGVQRNITVGTVSVNSVPIDLGVGDNLPIATTAIVACVQTVLDLNVAAADIALVAVGMSRRGTVQFLKDDDTVIKIVTLGAADALATTSPSAESWHWAVSLGDATPFSDDVGKVLISNGSSAGTNTVKIGLAVDNDA